jgi:hypothetical protein
MYIKLTRTAHGPVVYISTTPLDGYYDVPLFTETRIPMDGSAVTVRITPKTYNDVHKLISAHVVMHDVDIFTHWKTLATNLSQCLKPQRFPFKHTVAEDATPCTISA